MNRSNIDAWHSGHDPIMGAMQLASTTGRLTPGDYLALGLVPAGWDHGNDVRQGPSMSEVVPERIARARADIEKWNRRQEISRIVWTDDELKTILKIARGAK